MTTEHQEALFQAAYDYTTRGLRVIALTGKAPNVQVHRRGLYDAFSHLSSGADVRKAFDHPQTTGIGILTDDPYYVVDIDGEEGAQAWVKITHGLLLPGSWVAKTGRGLHLWYAHSKMWCDCALTFRTTKLGEKLDFKGAGGYVAAPPSLHPDGHQYEWLLAPSDDSPPIEMPDYLHEMLVMQERMKQQRQVTGEMSKREKHKILEDGVLWNTFSFDGPLDAVRNAKDGNRNNMLMWAACCMYEDGADPNDISDLVDAATKSGLSGREVMQTIRSARKKVRA